MRNSGTFLASPPIAGVSNVTGSPPNLLFIFNPDAGTEIRSVFKLH